MAKAPCKYHPIKFTGVNKGSTQYTPVHFQHKIDRLEFRLKTILVYIL